MKKLLLFITILLIISSVNAATIQGSVYDFNLDLLKNTIIEIDTIPKQSFVAKDASYSFEVSNGDYILTAIYAEENYILYKIEETIKITEDGTYNLDLILFPSIDEEFFEGEDIEIIDFENGETNYPWIILIIVLVIIFLIILFWKKKPKTLEDDISNKVLEIIKKQGGRTTQKEIRKQIPMSEAKISLVISELEHKGILKKIKKGRGNIIILEKR